MGIKLGVGFRLEMDGGSKERKRFPCLALGDRLGKIAVQDATNRAGGLIAIGCALRFAGEGEPVAGGAGKQTDI
ncbi:MAG: hypothetical protein EAZ61_13025 [Oscillatoriales cyanobacterium]|nr:MAG: hypothetical protein EAZ61_13025 [Oscillatoriales cyanobacterium]